MKKYLLFLVLLGCSAVYPFSMLAETRELQPKQNYLARIACGWCGVYFLKMAYHGVADHGMIGLIVSLPFGALGIALVDHMLDRPSVAVHCHCKRCGSEDVALSHSWL